MLNQKEIINIFYKNLTAAKALDTIGIVPLPTALQQVNYLLDSASDEASIKHLTKSKHYVEDLYDAYDEPETILVDKWKGYDEAFVATQQTIEDANKELKAVHAI